MTADKITRQRIGVALVDEVRNMLQLLCRRTTHFVSLVDTLECGSCGVPQSDVASVNVNIIPRQASKLIPYLATTAGNT
jgi:hypothetical protein|eukprot:COSAG01_NODE_34236_length_551_cov_0.674779_1_plen_79_part_00